MDSEYRVLEILERYKAEFFESKNAEIRTRFARNLHDQKIDAFRMRLFLDLAEFRPFSDIKDSMCWGVANGRPASHSVSDWIIREFLKQTPTPEIHANGCISIRRNSASYLEVTVIRGVSVQEPIVIDADTWLAHNNTIDSELARSLFARRFGPYSSMDSNAGAIVQRVRIDPAISPRNDDANDPVQRSRSLDGLRRSDDRKKIRRALLMASDSPVFLSTTFSIPEQADLLSVEQGGWGPYRDRFYGEGSIISAVEFRHVAGLLEKFDGLDSIGLAIDRLGASRESEELSSRIIDLGMALEIALTHGEGSGRNQEIRNKLSTRAGWLLGHDVNTRIEQGNFAAALYDARSSAVHTGRLKTKPGFRPRDAATFVRKCLLNILETGGFPDWKMLVYGGL